MTDIYVCPGNRCSNQESSKQEIEDERCGAQRSDVFWGWMRTNVLLGAEDLPARM